MSNLLQNLNSMDKSISSISKSNDHVEDPSLLEYSGKSTITLDATLIYHSNNKCSVVQSFHTRASKLCSDDVEIQKETVLLKTLLKQNNYRHNFTRL